MVVEVEQGAGQDIERTIFSFTPNEPQPHDPIDLIPTLEDWAQPQIARKKSPSKAERKKIDSKPIFNFLQNVQSNPEIRSNPGFGPSYSGLIDFMDSMPAIPLAIQIAVVLDDLAALDFYRKIRLEEANSRFLMNSIPFVFLIAINPVRHGHPARKMSKLGYTCLVYNIQTPLMISKKMQLPVQGTSAVTSEDTDTDLLIYGDTSVTFSIWTHQTIPLKARSDLTKIQLLSTWSSLNV